MKNRILKNWNIIRFIWLGIGMASAITAFIQGNYFLLLPAGYFILGSVLNVGCFAQSCAVNFTNKEKGEASNAPLE